MSCAVQLGNSEEKKTIGFIKAKIKERELGLENEMLQFGSPASQ